MTVGWVAATSVAMLLASQAVGLVRDQVTDRPSRVATTLALETTTSTRTGATITTTTTTQHQQQQQPSSTSTTERPAETSTTQPEATTTTAPTTTTTTTAVTTTSTASNQEETFYLVGGWATVRCAGDEVILATYAPNPGYQVDIEAAAKRVARMKVREIRPLFPFHKFPF